jgi:hypothetical protein
VWHGERHNKVCGRGGGCGGWCTLPLLLLLLLLLLLGCPSK